jgi:hypothetical protein
VLLILRGALEQAPSGTAAVLLLYTVQRMALACRDKPPPISTAVLLYLYTVQHCDAGQAASKKADPLSGALECSARILEQSMGG